MATPIDLLFETRTLLDAVNNPELDAEPRFIIENFWGAPKTVFGKYADWEINNGRRKLARFRGSGAAANVVRHKEKNVKTVTLPYIREKTPLTAPELFQQAGVFGQVQQDAGGYLDQARNESINEDLTTLKTRVQEREEWMACQILTTPGVVSYEDEEVAWTLDMGIPSDLKVTLLTTDRWSDNSDTSTSNPLDDLETLAGATQKYTGLGITDLILGTNAAIALRNNWSLKEDLHNNNFQAGSIKVDFQSNLMGQLASGIRIWRYRRQYLDENDATQEMWPLDVGVGLTASFKRNSQRLYGVVEEVEETFAGELFSKSWTENDPSVRWILVSSRPLPIVKQIGSFVKITPI